MMMMTKSRRKKNYGLFSGRRSFSEMLKALLFLIFVFPVFFCAGQQTVPGNQRLFPKDYPVIHPQFRKWAYPSGNNVISSLQAILQWPIHKKAGAAYDVRLSPDSSFGGQQTIHQENIPWTIFNPHQKLKEGNWYWQYRLHNGEWSPLNKFRVIPDSGAAYAPPVERFFAAIPKTHPRVLMEQADKKIFVQQVSGSPDAQIILKNANEILDSAVPDEEEGVSDRKGRNKDEERKFALSASGHAGSKMYGAIALLCKAYEISGNEKYAEKAIGWARALAGWDPDGASSLSDFGDARCMLAMALAFDTFHDRFTGVQRDSLLKAIGKRAGRFYRGWINNIDAKVLSNHVWQYILDYFFQTAVAVYGECDEAGDWLRYAYELWLARAPILGGKDGGWAYGSAYFRLDMETQLDIPAMIKRFTGFDFVRANEWYRKNPDWMLYAFPPGSSCDGFGDDVEKVFSPGTEYLAYADALSKLTGNRTAAWYAGKIEQVEKIRLEDAEWLRWYRMRYLRNAKRPAPANITKLPPAKLFKDIGVVEMHTDLSDHRKDLMVAFRSCPFGSYGHLLADQNTFNVLFGGQRLFYMSGHKVAMQDPHRLQWYKATRGHNGILIDDKGQPFNVEAYGYIPRFLTGREISYAVGDASQAYSSKAEKQEAGLKKFRRHVLFLRPDILLVYDDLEADHPAKWSWLIHSEHPIKMDTAKNQFGSASENVFAQATLFSSQALRWELSDTFAIAAVNWRGSVDEDGNLIEFKNDQWHLTAESVHKSNRMRFLAVMRIDATGRVAGDPVPFQLNEKGELKLGNWIIHAEMDISKPALLEAHRNDKQVAITSGADRLPYKKGDYNGKIKGSAKLVEWTDGRYVFSETGDVIPDVVKEIPVKTAR